MASSVTLVPDLIVFGESDPSLTGIGLTLAFPIHKYKADEFP